MSRFGPLLLASSLLLAACGGDDDDSSDGGPPDVATRICREWAPAVARANVQDEGLSEISGIVTSAADPDLLWVHEDSGGPAVITALGLDGRTRGTVTLTGVANIDWEDMAAGPCGDQACLFVGDFGDNGNSRTDVSILRLVEPAVDGDGFELEVAPDVLPYGYADGPVDAEAMFIDVDGHPVIVEKVLGGSAALHRLAELTPDDPVVAEELAVIATSEEGAGLASAVTGADLRRDGASLLIRTYGQLLEYPVPDGGLAELGQVERQVMPRGVELQGEAACWSPDGLSAWHVAEGGGAVIYEVPCLVAEELE